MRFSGYSRPGLFIFFGLLGPVERGVTPATPLSCSAFAVRRHRTDIICDRKVLEPELNAPPFLPEDHKRGYVPEDGIILRITYEQTGTLRAFLCTSIWAPSCHPVRLRAFRATKVAWMGNPLQGTTSWYITPNITTGLLARHTIAAAAAAATGERGEWSQCSKKYHTR